MGSHSVTSTRHKRTHPTFTPTSQAGTRFTYPGGMEGWVDLGDLIHTEMVYQPADGHPSEYYLGPVSINFVDQANAANHYTTPPYCCSILGLAGRRPTTSGCVCVCHSSVLTSRMGLVPVDRRRSGHAGGRRRSVTSTEACRCWWHAANPRPSPATL